MKNSHEISTVLMRKSFSYENLRDSHEKTKAHENFEGGVYTIKHHS